MVIVNKNIFIQNRHNVVSDLIIYSIEFIVWSLKYKVANNLQ